MRLGLVRDFPHLEEANGRMEAVENGQRHGDVNGGGAVKWDNVMGIHLIRPEYWN